MGDAQSAKDGVLLNKHNIMTVISIGEEAYPKTTKHDVVYHRVALRDQKTENMIKYVGDVIGLIDKGRQVGNVLVHCYHGSSRSASFVIAYLINKAGIDFDNAKQFVKARRPSVSPN